MPANVDSMMYVGETPWHREGVKLDNPPTIEEAIVKAGLDWTVVKLSTFSPNLDNDEEYFGNHASMNTGHFHTWRVDHPKKDALGSNYQINGDFINKRRRFTPLGSVSSRYGVLQNREAFEPFQVLLDKGYTLETAGALDGGKKVWILAKAPERAMVGNDVLDRYALLYTSHDASAGSQFRPTMTRVVCQNTVDIAIKSNRENSYQLKHTSNIKQRVNQLTDKLIAMDGNVRKAIDDMNRMTEVVMTRDALNVYLESVVPFLVTRHKKSNPEQGIIVRNNAKKVYEKMVENFYHGRGNKGRTLWDAYNAVTEYYTHQKQYSTSWVKSTQFAKPYNYKVQALEVAKRFIKHSRTVVTAPTGLN
jgi:phage/plasmid-like protein (TIGR03299 family)